MPIVVSFWIINVPPGIGWKNRVYKSGAQSTVINCIFLGRGFQFLFFDYIFFFQPHPCFGQDECAKYVQTIGLFIYLIYFVVLPGKGNLLTFRLISSIQKCFLLRLVA